mmetsp:Transcript_13845/g.21592  ORF Transcript_13845/g.21592 Transcript_13845/m.21592 type:complete len:248 (-) Transcript_13845:1325-2068(-)
MWDPSFETEDLKLWRHTLSPLYTPLLCVSVVELVSVVNVESKQDNLTDIQAAYEPFIRINFVEEEGWQLIIDRDQFAIDAFEVTIRAGFNSTTTDSNGDETTTTAFTSSYLLGQFSIADERAEMEPVGVLNSPPGFSGPIDAMLMIQANSSKYQVNQLPRALDMNGDKVSLESVTLGQISLFASLLSESDYRSLGLSADNSLFVGTTPSADEGDGPRYFLVFHPFVDPALGPNSPFDIKFSLADDNS